MLRNYNLSGLKWKDPRVAMRAVLGVLLLANLVTAVIAFKPFGGGADDLRHDRDRLRQQLAQLKLQVAKNKKLVDKIETARSQGDQFLAKYFTERRVVTSTIQGELVQIAKDAGITYQPTTWNIEAIEGSDTLAMMMYNESFQSYYIGYGSAVSVVLFLIAMVIIVIYFRQVRSLESLYD